MSIAYQNQESIIAAMVAGEITQADACAALQALTANSVELAVEQAKAKQPKKTGLHVSDKGGVIYYMKGRKFPFTFYAHEITDILSKKDEIETFVAANGDKLVTPAQLKVNRKVERDAAKAKSALEGTTPDADESSEESEDSEESTELQAAA